MKISEGATSLDLAPLLASHSLDDQVGVRHGGRRRPARLRARRGRDRLPHLRPDPANVAPLVKVGKAVPLFSGASTTAGAFVRDPTFPDPPHFIEFNQQATARRRPGLPLRRSRPSTRPASRSRRACSCPGTPADIVAAYARAFQAVVPCPWLQGEGGRRDRRLLGQATGPPPRRCSTWRSPSTARPRVGQEVADREARGEVRELTPQRAGRGPADAGDHRRRTRRPAERLAPRLDDGGGAGRARHRHPAGAGAGSPAWRIRCPSSTAWTRCRPWGC